VLIYRAASQPDVVVYAHADQKRPTILCIIIENIGKGVAQDVAFKLDRWIPERFWLRGRTGAEGNVVRASD